MTKKAVLLWGELESQSSMQSHYLAGGILEAIEKAEARLMESIETYFDHNRISVDEFELLRDALMVYTESCKK